VAKWADNLISAVRFNAAGTHIDKVKSHVDNGDTVGSSTEVTRATVVANLDAGQTYKTIFKNAQSQWDQGAPVRVVVIDGQKFIRTDADKIKSDNLDKLPTF